MASSSFYETLGDAGVACNPNRGDGLVDRAAGDPYAGVLGLLDDGV